MKAADFATLILRLLAVYCFIAAVPYLREFGTLVEILRVSWDEDSELPRAGIALITLFPTMALIGGGVFLWRLAGPLGRRLAGPLSEEPFAPQWTTVDAQALAFAVVGVLVAALAIPRLCYAVVNTLVSRDPLYAESPMARGAWTQLIREGVQLAIGLGLFFGSRGLSVMWHRLRTAGRP